MSSAWMTFQSAGPFGFGILACAVVSLVVALAAVVVAFATKRAGPWTSAAALLLSGAGLALGGVGTWLSRGKVDAALAGASIEWSKLEEIYVEGYREARDVSVVAAVLLALPLLLSLVAAGAAVARARGSEGQRAGLALGVLAITGSFALLGATSSIAGLRSGEATARARAAATMKSELASFLPRHDCDACAPLADALRWRGAEQLESEVPGAKERARRCVDERLAAIDSGSHTVRQRCNSDDPPAVSSPPPPSPAPTPASSALELEGDASAEAAARKQALEDAAEFGIIGLLGQSEPAFSRRNRLEDLHALRESPLLLDDDQRRKVQELIAAEQKRAARAAPAPTLGDTLFGGGTRRKAPTLRMGATSVSGRLAPEVIQRIVRQNYGRFRLCYETGLRRNPKLEGRINVRFVIARDGSVSSSQSVGSDFADAEVVACVVRAFSGLSFPQPEGGIVSVGYPLLFTPGE